MTAYEKIIQLLKQNNIDYKELRHAEVRTSEEAANLYERESLGITQHQGAKALLMKLKIKNTTDAKSGTSNSEKIIMLVLPGDKRFDSKKLKQDLDAKEIRFLTEEEVIVVTNGVKPGGVPPFGNIFGIEMIIDPEIYENEYIAFNAGDKGISIVMKSEDWRKLVS